MLLQQNSILHMNHTFTPLLGAEGYALFDLLRMSLSNTAAHVPNNMIDEVAEMASADIFNIISGTQIKSQWCHFVESVRSNTATPWNEKSAAQTWIADRFRLHTLHSEYQRKCSPDTPAISFQDFARSLRLFCDAGGQHPEMSRLHAGGGVFVAGALALHRFETQPSSPHICQHHLINAGILATGLQRYHWWELNEITKLGFGVSHEKKRVLMRIDRAAWQHFLEQHSHHLFTPALSGEHWNQETAEGVLTVKPSTWGESSIITARIITKGGQRTADMLVSATTGGPGKISGNYLANIIAMWRNAAFLAGIRHTSDDLSLGEEEIIMND